MTGMCKHSCENNKWGEALGLMYSATESFRLWHRTDFQQDAAEERQEENKYHR